MVLGAEMGAAEGGLVVPYDEIVDYVRQSLAGSEFTLQSLAYAEPDLLRLELQHTTHGTLELLLQVEVFNVDAESAFTRLKLVDFAVADNDFAQLVVELMGSKLIMAIVDLVIDRVDIDADSVTTKYEQGSISVDFTAGGAAAKQAAAEKSPGSFTVRCSTFG